MKFYNLLAQEITKEEHLAFLENRRQSYQEEVDDLNRFTALNAGDFYYLRIIETAITKIDKEIERTKNSEEL